MQVRYDLLPEDIKAARRYKGKPPVKTSWRGCFPMLLFAFAHFVVWPTSMLLFFGVAAEIWWVTLLILIGQMACLAVFVVFIVLSPRSQPPLPKGYDKGITMTIGHDWLRVGNSLSESACRWTEVAKIGVTKEVAIFFIETNKMFVVPRRTFADQESWILFLDRAKTLFENAHAVEENAYKEVT